MYFVKQNIRDFFTDSRDVFVMFLILQVISVFSVFFIYGIVCNSQREEDNMTLESYELEASFESSDGGDCLYKNLSSAIPEFLEEFGEKLEGMSVLGFYEEYYLISYNGFEGGQLTRPAYGRTGDAVILEGRDLEASEYSSPGYLAMGNECWKAGDTVEMDGNTYTVVGVRSSLGISDKDRQVLYVPYLSLPDSMELVGIYLRFHRLPTESDYYAFRDALQSAMGEENVQLAEIYLDKPARRKALRSLNLVAVAVGLLASFDIFVVYNSIIEKRRKKNSVIQICGCSYRSMCRYLLTEILLLTLASFLAGGGLFLLARKLWLDKAFTYFSESFGFLAVMRLTLLYFVTTGFFSAFLSLRMNKKEPVELLRRSYYA